MRQTFQALSRPSVGFQSTHPRGMRLEKDWDYCLVANISIHASAWDATDTIDWAEMFCIISIHASAWDATNNILSQLNQ